MMISQILTTIYFTGYFVAVCNFDKAEPIVALPLIYVPRKPNSQIHYRKSRYRALNPISWSKLK
jgi:hypothetical protein